MILWLYSFFNGFFYMFGGLSTDHMIQSVFNIIQL